MARRLINKAYNDLVGGAGSDVSAAIGTDVARKSSVLKVSSKDVRYGNRQAVEMRPNAGQATNVPVQMDNPLRRDNVKLEGKGKNIHFVNIDGSAKEVDVPPVQQSKTLPPTAYKMKSFMSTLELGPHGYTQKQTLVNRNPGKKPLPRREPDIPKALCKEDPIRKAKMFLPKGINQTDQPYVVPKFMPTYREMMLPKPKPDPLVSIVETTPPSLQKWAVEWNSTAKKTISIDELKEDLIREAAENSHGPQNRSQRMSSMNESNHDETYEDGESDQLKNQSNYIETTEKNHPNGSEIGRSPSPPWKDLHIPASYETTVGAQLLRDPEPNQQKVGRPLVDWVPPKYTSPNKKSPYDPRVTEYSFQGAINNGMPVKRGMSGSNTNAGAKPFPSTIENDIYLDTEQHKFHEWFKEKMSAAVQSAVTHPTNTLKNNHPQSQNPQSGAHSAFKDPSKYGTAVPPENSGGHDRLAQAEGHHSKHTDQNDGWKDLETLGRIPPEVRNHPKSTSNVLATSLEHESNSSFYQWLKLRGNHILKNEPKPPANKKEPEKTNQNQQNAPQYPWSVSYALRKRISTPKVITKGPPPSSKHLTRPSKTVPQDDVNMKHLKRANQKAINSFGRSIKSESLRTAAKKFPKTLVKRSVKSAAKKSAKSAGDISVKHRLNKKMAKPEPPRQNPARVAASADHLWLNDGWNLSSENDHVNNLRGIETSGQSPKAPNAKKLFPSLAGSPMKYWESKYIKKPGSPQNHQRVPQTIAVEVIPNPYKWFKSRKTTDGFKNVLKEISMVRHADSKARPPGQDSPNFSSIAECSRFPLKLSRNARDRVMDFSDDFDMDNFLYKEEAEAKELQLASQQPRENNVKPEHENTVNKQVTEKGEEGKEHIKFPRTVKVRPEANDSDIRLRQRVEQKLDEDDLVLALGEDPGTEDLEWSEFIGPRNSFDLDSDLNTLVPSHARH